MRRSICFLAVTFAASCASWDHTRTHLVDPVNALVHSAYPKAFRALDAAAYADLHAEAARATARTEADSMFAEWTSIERAYCVIHSVTPTDDDHITADCTLRLDGVRATSSKCTTFQRQRIDCRFHGDAWEITSIDSDPADIYATAGTRFVDETSERGIAFVQASCGVEDRCGVVRAYLPGSGLGIGDVDHDGFDDAVLVGGRDIKLFLNRGGRFEDATEARGFGPVEQGEARYAIIVDIDNDGDRDVFVGMLDHDNILFRNRGDAHFDRVGASELGITPSRESTGACFADFDGDGTLDIYVANGANLLQKDPEPVYNAWNGTANQLFVQDANGRFREVTEKAGVGDTGWALACTASDYDSDGDVDLFVANDFGQDRLYRNDGHGRFEEISEDVGIVYRGSSMGATFGDADGDGDLDVFVAGMASNSRWIVDQAGYPAPAPWPVSWLFRPHVLAIVKEMFHGNRFYANLGNGEFQEVSMPTGTANSGWAWGGVFFDYDNDSHLDLYVLNGLISGEVKDDL